MANTDRPARRHPRATTVPRATSAQRVNSSPRRHPPYIYRRRRIAAISILVFLLLMVVFIAGACGPGPTRTLQGDQLGPEPEESVEQYQTRAAASVADARRDTFALVTFDEPTNANTAAQAIDGATRVNAVIPQQQLVPVDIPEPIQGETHEDVFDREIGDEDINSVIIYDKPDVLEEIAAREGILAVEAAPSDAAWGSFGIRPVMKNET